MPMTCAETQLRTRVKASSDARSRSAGPPTSPSRSTAAQPCHYCGPCERGCVTHSYFNSAFTTVADALATGNCTLITDAMVYKVLMDPQTAQGDGRALHRPHDARGEGSRARKAVVLCAQALESARILLNSSTTQFPSGLANSSGVLGHYLMDHLWVAGGASGEFPDVPSPRRSLSAPRRPSGIYGIRFRNTMNGPRHKDFLRGYGFQGGGEPAFNWTRPGSVRRTRRRC